MSLLDFLFPKFCVNCRKVGDYICANCFTFISFDQTAICPSCNRPSINGLTHPKCQTKYGLDGIFSTLSYKGIVKKLVYNFKYNPYLGDLKNLLAELFYEGLIQKEDFYNIYQKYSDSLILVPVPLYKSRQRARGYNQAEILAGELSKKFNIKTLSVLKRVKKTVSQVGLSKIDRRKNIKDSFEINEDLKSVTKDHYIFLVDDVFTTGSTLIEASKVLKRHGAKKVWGLTLARD